jgi:hypothetical protein
MDGDRNMSNITNTQKAVLEHVLDILENINNQDIYRKLEKTLKESNIDVKITNQVLAGYTHTHFENITKQIVDSKRWIRVLLSDIT